LFMARMWHCSVKASRLMDSQSAGNRRKCL
jgi:hypothetical protein